MYQYPSSRAATKVTVTERLFDEEGRLVKEIETITEYPAGQWTPPYYTVSGGGNPPLQSINSDE